MFIPGENAGKERENDQRSCKQIATTHGSSDVPLILFTQGTAGGGSSALTSLPCPFVLMFFGALLITHIQTVERWYSNDDWRSLANTCTVPKKESHEGPPGGRYLSCPFFTYSVSSSYTSLLSVFHSLWKLISLEQGGQNGPAFMISKDNILVLCSIHSYSCKSFMVECKRCLRQALFLVLTLTS